MIWTKDHLLTCYSNLSSPTKAITQQANSTILTILNSDQIWNITKQLIVEQSLESQFIGAQILYQKTLSALPTMQHQQKLQLKDFVFKTLFDSSIQAFPVIQKLASTCAVIVCLLIEKEWKQFIEDVHKGYKSSLLTLMKTLAVLEEIPEEWKDIKGKSYEDKSQIKRLFLLKSDVIKEIFQSGFQILKEDQKSKMKLLRCIKNWAKFGFKILEEPGLVELVIESLNEGQSLRLAEEILSQSMRLSCYTLGIPFAFEAKSQLSGPCLLSLSLITQQIIKEQSQSVPYSYLIKFTITYNPWILRESNQITEIILTKELELLKNPSLDISYSSLEFWIELFSDPKLIDIGKSYIGQIFQYVVERLSNNITLQTMEEEEGEELDEERYLLEITKEEYQQQCSKLFSQLYRCCEESRDIMLKCIIHLIQQPEQNKVLLGLFIFKSIVAQTQPSPIISEVMQYILKLQNISPSLKIESFRILMDLDTSTLNITSIFNYIRAYFQSPGISQYAINTFQVVVSKFHYSYPNQFYQSLLQFLSQDFFKIPNYIDAEKICYISFQAIISTADQFVFQQIFKQTLPHTILLLSQLQSHLSEQSINLLIMIHSLLQYFLTIITRNPQQNIAPYFYDYTSNVVAHLFNIVSVLKDNISYKQDNHLHYVKQIYLKSLAISGRTLHISTQLFTLVCQMIHSNQENLEMLSIITSTIQNYFEVDPFNQKETRNSEELASWTESHLPVFNQFLYTSILKQYDPDLVRVFFDLQLVLLKYDIKLVLTESLELGIHCLANIFQPQMLRSVLRYFNEYVYYAKQKQVVKRILYAVFPLFRIDGGLVSDILVRCLSVKQNQDLVGQYPSLLRSVMEGSLTRERIEMLSESLSSYSLGKQKMAMVQLFSQLDSEGSGYHFYPPMTVPEK